MKPILLTMQAFGPFKHQVSVDFTSLNQGLFLISGPTGAGKTSLFDALCFALYNEASGENKESKMMRSDFADNETETYVEFTFSHQQDIYRIYRRPSYLKQKRNKEEWTTRSGDARLYKNEGLIKEGVKEVTLSIEQIIGVKANQFKQIVMIAQGEFLKLLLTKSDERVKIFRKIFATHYYQNIQNTLKESYNKIAAQYQGVQDKSELLQQEMGIDSYMNFSDLLLWINNQEERSIKNLEISTKLVQQKEGAHLKASLVKEKMANENMQITRFLAIEKDYKEYKEENQALINEKNPLVHQQKMAVLLNPIYQAVKAYLDELKELEKTKTQLTQQITQLKDEEKTLADLNIQLINQEKYIVDIKEKMVLLENQKGQYEAYDSLKKTQEELKEKHTRLQIEIDAITTEKESINHQIIKANQQQVELFEKTSQQVKLEQFVEQMKKQKENQEKLKELKELLKKELPLFEQSQLAQQEKQKDYDYHEHAFYQAQAGLLASTLSPNKPCPVCGSLEHPSPATYQREIMNKQKLDRHKQELEKLKEMVNQKRSFMEQNSYDLNRIQQEIKTNWIEEKDYEKQLTQINQEIIHLNKQKEWLIQAEQKLQSFESIVQVKQLENQSLVIRLAENEGKLTSIKSGLAYDNLTEAKNVYQSFLEKTQVYQQSKEHHLEAVGKNEQESVKVKALLDSIHQSMSDKGSKLEDKQKALSEINYSYEDASQLIKQSHFIQDKLEKISEVEKHLDRKQANLEGLKGALSCFSLHDMSVYQERENELVLQLNDEKKAHTSLQLQLKEIEKWKKRVKQLIKESEVLDTQYHLLQPLSDCANGNISGKQRLTFEIYVQSVYFEKVLILANQRLRKMSNQRYRLQLKKQNNLQSLSGLDLEVYDEWTMRYRDVKTLSGGESFKASLSLALGTSDMITQSASGLELDCLFIDEGFGTLDQESLEQAMDILQDLATQDKLVGIISHVETLKQQIDHKILVEKDYDGSHVSVVI
ncbi:MAG: SMC family ATPase [Erysipelotrichaceae bacterium]